MGVTGRRSRRREVKMSNIRCMCASSPQRLHCVSQTCTNKKRKHLLFDSFLLISFFSATVSIPDKSCPIIYTNYLTSTRRTIWGL